MFFVVRLSKFWPPRPNCIKYTGVRKRNGEQKNFTNRINKEFKECFCRMLCRVVLLY